MMPRYLSFTATLGTMSAARGLVLMSSQGAHHHQHPQTVHPVCPGHCCWIPSLFLEWPWIVAVLGVIILQPHPVWPECLCDGQQQRSGPAVRY